MKEIKPTEESHEKRSKFFDPMTGKPNDGSPTGTKMVCVCGYELVKEDDCTYKCTGGNHRYRIGEWFLDKNGNVLLKQPDSNKEEC